MKLIMGKHIFNYPRNREGYQETIINVIGLKNGNPNKTILTRVNIIEREKYVY